MYRIGGIVLQKAFDLLQEATKQLPDIGNDEVVFHYTSPEGLKGITDHKCILATDINYLNDTSEFRYIFRLAKELVKKKTGSWSEDFIRNVVRQCDTIIEKRDLSDRLISSVNEDYYVVSFCLEQDNLNMWRYYTKTEKSIGYNIGFANLASKSSVLDSRGNTVRMQMFHRKVIYDKEMQEHILERFLGEYAKLYSDQAGGFKKTEALLSADAFLKSFSIFFKHPAFSDEKEYRIVIRDQHFDDLRKKGTDYVHFRVKDGVFVPYVKLYFDKACIDSIGISPSVTQNVAEYSVKRMLEKEYKLGNEKYFRSSIPFNP